METRSANIIMTKSRSRADSNSYNYKLPLPKKWIDQLGIDAEHKAVEMTFDGDKIFIERQKTSDIKINPKKIHKFALVWVEMYKHYETVPFDFFENNQFVGEGLAECGFTMDSGESFKRKFPNMSIDDLQFNEIELNQLDIITLGNTIFSQWRYWNHWSMSPMIAKDFEWFVVTFSKLAELTE